MSDRRDRVREKLAKLVWLDGGDNDHGWETSHCFVHKDGLPYAIADAILSLPEIAVLAEDQSLPMKVTGQEYDLNLEQIAIVKQMFKVGWRKVV